MIWKYRDYQNKPKLFNYHLLNRIVYFLVSLMDLQAIVNIVRPFNHFRKLKLLYVSSCLGRVAFKFDILPQ